jgi:hypothetical protein
MNLGGRRVQSKIEYLIYKTLQDERKEGRLAFDYSCWPTGHRRLRFDRSACLPMTFLNDIFAPNG